MLLLACLCVGIGLVTAQTQKVTGVVISEEDGQPVVGASVLVKGTTLERHQEVAQTGNRKGYFRKNVWHDAAFQPFSTCFLKFFLNLKN